MYEKCKQQLSMITHLYSYKFSLKDLYYIFLRSSVSFAENDPKCFKLDRIGLTVRIPCVIVKWLDHCYQNVWHNYDKFK